MVLVIGGWKLMGVKKVIGSQTSDPCYRVKIRITQLLAEIWHTAYKSLYKIVSGGLISSLLYLRYIKSWP